jgi:hypothetical protein
VTALPVFAVPRARAAGSAPTTGTSETLVKTLYDSLSNEQRTIVCKKWNDPLRSKVDNNWNITPLRIRQLKRDQQEMVHQIFRGVHSEEYYPKILQQLMDDAGGIDNYTIAIFGEPGHEKFEWVLTGRHMTVRCDGHSVEGKAFGGPIFYGHAARGMFNEPADHPGNIYWYQALRANEVFRALDGKQRDQALLGDAPEEQGNATVAIRANRRLPGVPVAALSRDQKELVEKVMADLLAPFRKVDADEAMKFVKANGGIDSLHLAFYKNADIGMDGVWDVWRLEGPAMVWYFRGAPHVHTWVNVAAHAEG